MKSILFLGYSNLIKQRILPILNRTTFTEVAIAKFEGQEWDDFLNTLPYSVLKYDNYDEGIKHFRGNVVYVSTVNCTHYQYAKKALYNGYNVIIDKPATLNLKEAEDIVALANEKDLLVCESTVYLEHPQLSIISELFAHHFDSPKLLTIHFTMPPFQPTNFRYRKDLGGGALFDTLPYAVSACRYFFKKLPLSVSCYINEIDSNGLDIEYSLLLAFEDGCAMIGHFGFNMEYLNQVKILGTRTNITVDRIFTIPDNLENKVFVDHLNNHEIVKSPCGNNFELFINRVSTALDTHDYEKLIDDMMYDAKVKQMIINNQYCPTIN
jgi:dTDP-3,4-didehydro-2,6-dideoxy-alpha-D-glucose 3-reductase